MLPQNMRGRNGQRGMEKGNMRKKWKRWQKVVLVLVLILAICGVGCGVYLGDYYHADEEAMAALKPDESVDVYQLDKKTYVFAPMEKVQTGGKVQTGLIFYPGGKVQCEAYAPLMKSCAQKGILCVLVQMPGNLAVLDMNAADGIQNQFPDIKTWLIGGHSLGGAMAASYAVKHAEEYDGLVLLAAYSTADLSDTGLRVLSVYGSEDGVMNREKYEQYRKNLPKDSEEEVIDGGCHAYFGNYGVQDGDGTPELKNEEQIEQTAELIGEFYQ